MPEPTSSTYLSPKFEEIDLNGRQVRFYPVSVALVFKMRGIAGPVLSSIVEMMSGTDNDIAVEERSTQEATKGITGTERIIRAIAPELLRERHAIRQATVERVVASLFADETKTLVFQAFVDSMRDEFPRGSWRDTKVVTDLADKCDAPTFVVMLKALLKANDEIIAPFKRQIPTKVADGIAKAMGDAGSDAKA